MQVLSPMPELLSHWLPADDAEYLADVMNDQIAAMIAQAPRNFAGIGMVCAQDVARAVAATAEGQGARSLPGSKSARISMAWRSAAKACFRSMKRPKRSISEFSCIRCIRPAWSGSEPARSSRRRRCSRWRRRWRRCRCSPPACPRDFRELRILLSHGGGALPWILPRMDFGWSLGAKGKMTQPPSKTRAAVLVRHHSLRPASLSFLSNAVGDRAIVVGSDYPFAIRQKQPGAFAKRALGRRSRAGRPMRSAFSGTLRCERCWSRLGGGCTAGSRAHG